MESNGVVLHMYRGCLASQYQCFLIKRNNFISITITLKLPQNFRFEYIIDDWKIKHNEYKGYFEYCIFTIQWIQLFFLFNLKKNLHSACTYVCFVQGVSTSWLIIEKMGLWVYLVLCYWTSCPWTKQTAMHSANSFSDKKRMFYSQLFVEIIHLYESNIIHK